MADMRAQMAEIASELNSVIQPPTEGREEPQPEGEDSDIQLAQAETQELEDDPGESPDNQEVQPDQGALEIKDLKGLVEAIDVEPEWLYGLEVPMGDNEPPVKLGALKDELLAAKRQSRELQQKIATQEQNAVSPQAGPDFAQWSQEMTQAHGVMTALEHQFRNTNWNDPDADKGELVMYRQQLTDAYAQARQAFEQAQGQQAQAQNQAFEAMKQRERDVLLQKVPEWSDRTKLQNDKEQMFRVAKEYGFGEQDFASVFDHRIYLLLRDLANLKSTSKKTAEAVKTVRKAPKVIGTRGRSQPNSSNQIDALIQQARTSSGPGKRQAQVKAVKAILSGG